MSHVFKGTYKNYYIENCELKKSGRRLCQKMKQQERSNLGHETATFQNYGASSQFSTHLSHFQFWKALLMKMFSHTFDLLFPHKKQKPKIEKKSILPKLRASQCAKYNNSQEKQRTEETFSFQNIPFNLYLLDKHYYFF